MSKPSADPNTNAPLETGGLHAGALELATYIEHNVSVGLLPRGTRLILQTANRDYLIETCGELDVLIQGHPDYCPAPILVYVRGSRRRGSAPQPGLIRRGMPVDFWDGARGIMITTSRVRRLRMLPRASASVVQRPSPVLTSARDLSSC